MTISFALKCYVIPRVIHWQVSKIVNLAKDSDIREIWRKYPDPFLFKLYLFNITNPEQVQNGGKPNVQEIGPYVYEEWKEKVDLYDHEEEDTVSFNNKDIWYFNEKESGSLTGDEIITIPHLLILGLILTIQREIPAMLPLVNKTIPLIFGQSDSIFMTATAKQLMFDGIFYNCSLTNYVAKVICMIVRARGKDLQKLGSDSFRFSFLGKKNATLEQRLKVYRGVQNVMDIGRVVALRHEPAMRIYKDARCNGFSGTDASIFPPFLKQDQPVKVFSYDLCRSLDILYEGPIEYRGIHGSKYNGDFGDSSSDPDLKCYCTTPSTCLRRGVHDLQLCKDAPLVASFPHFHLADAEYLNGVTGLRPLKEIHETTIHFEPLTGTPLRAYKRIQFNIALRSVKKLEITRKLRTVLIPLFWLEESVTLTEDLIQFLTLVLTLLYILDIIIGSLIALGSILAFIGIFLVVKKLTKKAMVSLGRNSPEVSPLDLQTPARY